MADKWGRVHVFYCYGSFYLIQMCQSLLSRPLHRASTELCVMCVERQVPFMCIRFIPWLSVLFCEREVFM